MNRHPGLGIAGLVLGLAALVAMPAPTWGYGDDEQDRNHPEVRWATSETAHFRFHYEKRLRSVAEACARRAEAVYPEVVALYDHAPPGKVDFLVFDEDYSNGWAIASLNTMAIWSADLGFEFRGTKDWIRDVVAHEFAHVVSIQKSSKLVPWLPEVQFGWSDASDRAVSSGGWVLWSLNPYSMAMAEGTAQWTSERMGGDRWDTHRRMITRVAARSDSLLPWSRLAVFSGTGLDFERVYGQGYGIVRDIAAEDAPETVKEWWAKLGGPLAQTPDGAWKRVGGFGADSLWRRWRDRMRAQADSEIAAAGPLVEGRKIFGDAFNTQHPRWWDDSTLLFSSNRGSDFQINALWGCDFRQADTAKRFWTVSPVIRSRFALDTAKKTVWFHSGAKDDSRGRPVLDIYAAALHRDEDGRWEASKKDEQTRTTKGMHAFAPSASGDSLAVVVRDRRSFRVRIVPADARETALPAGRDVFPARDSLGEWPVATIFAAVWHPDGKRLAVDWFDGRRRRIDLVDRAGTVLARLGDSLSEWRDPAFASDGSAVWMASDRTGIFNLYKQNLSSMEIAQATSVAGGAFQPAPASDGRRVAYSGWGTDGFGLYLLDSAATFAPRAAAVEPPPVPEPEGQTWDLASRERPYSAIPNRFLLSPIVYAQRNPPFFGSEGNRWKAMLGARFQMLDPARRNILYLLGMVDLTNGFDYVGPSHRNFVNPRQEKLFVAGIENRSFVPTLEAEVSYQGLRGDDDVRSADPRDPDADSVVSREPWALHMVSASAGARYSLTRNQKIHASLRWSGYDFDYYEYPFRFEGYSGVTPSVFWTWLSRTSSGDRDPRGTFARLEYSADVADLKRQGSFSEVFQQNANGSLTVRMSKSVVHRVMADLRAGFANPLWDAHTIEADASFAGIVGWTSDADTLNDFFLEGLSIPGYPTYLPGRSSEQRLFEGRRSAVFSLSYRAPLWEIRKLAWIWFLDTWSAGVSLHAGRAWSGEVLGGRAIDQVEDFSRSVAWETRISGTLHSAYPFQLYTRFARALDEPSGLVQKTATIEAGSLKIPTGAHRIEFGINLGLDEWAIIDQPQRHRATILPQPSRVSVPSPSMSPREDGL